MEEETVNRVRGPARVYVAAGCQPLAEAADSILDGLLSTWINSSLVPPDARTLTAMINMVTRTVPSRVVPITAATTDSSMNSSGTQPCRKLRDSGSSWSRKNPDQQHYRAGESARRCPAPSSTCAADQGGSQLGSSGRSSVDMDSVQHDDSVAAPLGGTAAAVRGTAGCVRMPSWPLTGQGRLAVVGMPAANHSRGAAVSVARREPVHQKPQQPIGSTPQVCHGNPWGITAPPGRKHSTAGITTASLMAKIPPIRRSICRTSSTNTARSTRARKDCTSLAAQSCSYDVSNPAGWLPQQHPAVVTALQRDLAAMPDFLVQHPDSSTGSVSMCSSKKEQTTVGSGADQKRGRSRQQQPIRLLAPQFHGTAPTLEFAAANRDGFKLLIAQPLVSSNDSSRLQFEDIEQQLTPGQQQPDDQGGPIWQLTNVKPFVKYYGVANNAVKKVFRESGFKRTKGDAWNVLWGSLAPLEMLTDITPFQKHNHFPGTWELGRKDRLYLNIASAARRTHGKAFTFVPKFFVLPGDADDFQLYLAQHPTATYIRKPAACSRGRGVRLIQDPKTLDMSSLKDVILQRYIADPLLIGGRKFDLRVYVAVTCLDPLRVYVYREGLVRFASEQYSTERTSLKNVTMHLTNYSINKTAKNCQQPSLPSDSAATISSTDLQQMQCKNQHSTNAKPVDCSGEDLPVAGGQKQSACMAESVVGCCKWSFGQLAAHLQTQGHDWQHIWEQVCNICVQTMIATEPALVSATRSAGVPNLMKSAFEVFGFDIMLDQSLQAWLLEVNTCPALNADSPLDAAVKTNMVADLLGLVGVTPYDRQLYQQRQSADRQKRLTGLTAATPAQPRPSSTSKPAALVRCRSKSSTAGRPMLRLPRPKAGSAGAATSTGAFKTLRDVQHVDLLSVSPEQLPDSIRETQAEWRRCCRQQQRWQRLFPVNDSARLKELIGLFETPRLSNAIVLSYYEQLQHQQF